MMLVIHIINNVAIHIINNVAIHGLMMKKRMFYYFTVYCTMVDCNFFVFSLTKSY
jgi:hypothetical protein